MVDPGGYLGVVDLADPQLRVRRSRLSQPVAGLAIRRTEERTSVLAMTTDNVLRSVSPVVPVPLQTTSGRPVFGRYHPLADEAPSSWTRLENGFGIGVQDFYSVVDGAAQKVDGLGSLCRPPVCDSAYACTDGSTCEEGICVPAAAKMTTSVFRLFALTACVRWPAARWRVSTAFVTRGRVGPIAGLSAR